MVFFDYDYCASRLNEIFDELEVNIFLYELCSCIAKRI